MSNLTQVQTGSFTSTGTAVTLNLRAGTSWMSVWNQTAMTNADDRTRTELRRRHIGFVFQSFNLQAHETALENVISPLVIGGVGRKKERRQRGLEALEKVGLADRSKHKPTQLSGGQRQRVAIARALANDPSVILADEPTGNLDSRSGAAVMDLIRDLNAEGRTVIIITHDREQAASLPRRVSVRDGLIESDEGVVGTSHT